MILCRKTVLCHRKQEIIWGKTPTMATASLLLAQGMTKSAVFVRTNKSVGETNSSLCIPSSYWFDVVSE